VQSKLETKTSSGMPCKAILVGLQGLPCTVRHQAKITSTFIQDERYKRSGKLLVIWQYRFHLAERPFFKAKRKINNLGYITALRYCVILLCQI